MTPARASSTHSGTSRMRCKAAGSQALILIARPCPSRCQLLAYHSREGTPDVTVPRDMQAMRKVVADWLSENRSQIFTGTSLPRTGLGLLWCGTQLRPLMRRV